MQTTRTALLVSIAIAETLGQTPEQPVRNVTDPGVVTTNQAVTPAGVQSVFQGRVYGVMFAGDSDTVWVLNAERIYRLGWRDNKVQASAKVSGRPGPQSLGDGVYLSATGEVVALYRSDGSVLTPKLGRFIAGHPAVTGEIAVVPLTYDNEAAVVDLRTGQVRGRVKTGIAPAYAVLNAAGDAAWVANWGGRVPKSGELTAATGLSPDADRVLVDKRGIASTGTLTRIDLKAMTATHELASGLHPVALAWDERGNRLYAANNNRDSITVVDTSTQRIVGEIPIQPFSRPVAGIAPTAIAISPNGEKLYVACGGINAIAIVNTASRKVEGLIPTAWYPSSLAVSADGSHLAVGTLLGVGSGYQNEAKRRYVHSYRGSVSVIAMPDGALLADYTNIVAVNNRLDLPGVTRAATPAAKPEPLPVPRRAGDPSLIEHVVFIIKENRTYDQLFGDLPRGNGDPSLVMFGEDVTPNHRKLAMDFVLLDNFYATGGNSADGHQWLTQANEVAYCLWPGYTGRSYPFDGTDPIAYSQSGFIWELAQKAGKTVRIYGEYAGRMAEPPRGQRVELFERWRKGDSFANEWNVTAPIEPMNAILARNYPTYTNSIPDVVRARIFLRDLDDWNRSGTMPNLILLQLPSDHTFGTTPGATTPKSMVADNDLALGQIVEGLTKSKFWPKMAIFVTEDDAQNGVDHVDGHRTVSLIVSPYTRRNSIDSTFYSHQSMLKTIELMLGLPSLTLFDLIAQDMRTSFTSKPDLTRYAHLVPKQSLTELNPPASALRGAEKRGALDSAKMRWDVPDAVPTDKLNRILWHSIKGWKMPYPGVKSAVFTPTVWDDDD
jgi:YVTN family beta-propeller protein